MAAFSRTLDLSRTALDRRPVVVALLPPSGRIVITFRWNKRAHRQLRRKTDEDGAYFFSLVGDDGTVRIRSRRVTLSDDMLATARAGDAEVPLGRLSCTGTRDPQVLDLADGTCVITYEEDEAT